MLVDDYLTGDYYEPCPNKDYEFGNFYITPAYYPHEQLEFWRPVQYLDNTTATHATHFRIQTAKPFQHGHPLADPPLKTDEEFIVVRAKIRPVLLLIPQAAIDGIDKLRMGSPIWRRRCLVGQVYSIHHPETNQLKLPASFIERIQELEFPHLTFLPAGGPLSVDSILRLDECQSVFTPHLQSTGFRLSEDMREIVQSQLTTFLTKQPTGAYEMYRRDIVNSKSPQAQTASVPAKQSQS